MAPGRTSVSPQVTVQDPIFSGTSATRVTEQAYIDKTTLSAKDRTIDIVDSGKCLIFQVLEENE